MKNLLQIAKADKTSLVTKKDGTLKERVKEALAYLVGNSRKIHYSYYTGSGRYVRLVTYQTEIEWLLRVAGYKFTTGNDAPKGGRNGDYIKVSKAALNFLNSLKMQE